MLNIRLERPEDVPQVRHINELVFETPAEAKIVDTLRQTCPNLLSLVAEDGNRIVGHILFIDPRVDNGTFCTKIEYA